MTRRTCRLHFTKQERQLALGILGSIQTVIEDRLKSFQRNTLTYKELSSVSRKIDQMKQQVAS